MTTGRIGRVDRSPIRGHHGTLKTSGAPQAAEVKAAGLAHAVSERDLDLFLQARQKKTQGNKGGGVLAWLKRLVAPPQAKPQAQAAHEIKQKVSRSLEEMGKIYADGVVDEQEMLALSNARDRIGTILKLADPQVLLMLPRDVRARLETQLFAPLEMIHAAATRRTQRVWEKVLVRDTEALRARLAEPRELRSLDINVHVRSGIAPSAISRYVPGDLISVPRSGGTYAEGVVVANFGSTLHVEYFDEHNILRKKELDAVQVADANPMKIGDAFRTHGYTVSVTGVNAQGLVGLVNGQAGGHHELKAAIDATMRLHANQSMLANGILNVPGLFHMGPALQNKMTALFNLRGDPVFDRMCDALRHETRSSEFRSLPPEQQAQRMIGILHRVDLLHSAVPSFGVVRSNVASVTYGNAHYDDGAKHFHTAGTPPRAVVQHLTMQIGTASRDFDVVFPDSWPHAKQHESMMELAETLKTLPPEALSSLQRIVMNPEANPRDKYWEQQYGIPGFQSAMTAHEGTRSITVYPCTTVSTGLQKFVHEVGHLVSIDAFGSIGGNGPGWDVWKNAANNDVLHVSKYAQKSPAEDFAETFALYTTTKGTARHDEYRGLMPHRFAILDEIARQAALT